MKKKFKKVLVELRPSKIVPKGIGVFAITNIKKGTKVFEGIHLKDFKHLVSWSDFRKLPKSTQRKVWAFCAGTPQGFVPPDNLDFNCLSIDWYLNHSCDGNMGFDKNGDFVAAKNIRPGDELTYDYGLVESNPRFRMKCVCETPTCRGTITGTDWRALRKDPTKSRLMHPFLKGNKS